MPTWRTTSMRGVCDAGGDQALNGSKLIGKATLNVLEPGGDHEITAAAEKRLYVGHEQVGFIEEVVCLRQLRGGGGIQRLNLSEHHASSDCAMQYKFCASHNNLIFIK